ncbi:O-antigen ligase family protein [Maribacter sp. TH_r10]|uniref:O-antigen ligase family protein n=1 Tax=Maribacter sp. TH_r10 TaxID=3082086 RepID=UPI002954602E|nr:O-antigen ligase family protein [Maribacter sp. TH_r10]MDV7137581.1 O-antigen ligase family protein [Maribacter sp. TH_r10]
MNFNWFLNYRENVFNALIVFLITSLPIGYLPSTLTLYILVLFFFIDKKSNLSNKLKIIRKSRLVLYYLVFFVIQIIGLTYTEYFEKGLTKVLVLLPFVFLPAIIISEGKTNGFKRVYLILKILIPIVFILIATGYAISDEYRGMDNFVQIWFVDKIGLSQFYLVFVLLLGVFFSIKDLNVNNLIFNVLLVLVSAYFILVMNNFTGLIFLVVSLLIFVRKVYYITSGKTFSIILGGLILLSVLVVNNSKKLERKYEPLITVSPNIDQIIVKNKYAYTRNSFEHRLYIAYMVISDWKNSFPFGVGTGDTQFYLNHLYKDNTFLTGIKYELNAHNQYLQEYLKTGILGLSVFLSFLIYILKESGKKNSIFFIFILFFGIACLMESYLNRYHGVIIFSGIIPIVLMDNLSVLTKRNVILRDFLIKHNTN